MKRIVCPSAVLMLLLCASMTFAQEARGTISGAVLDPTGAAIPNVKVSVTELRTGVVTATTSDSSGAYNLPFLPPGEYKLEATTTGFKQYVRGGIQLSASDHPIIDLKLQMGPTSQTVTVEAASPLLDTADSAVAQTISTKQVEDFPLNGRNPMMVAQLALGVVATANPTLVHPFDNGAASAWSIAGTPSQSAEILMDGAPNATWDNRVAYTPPQDAVEEVKVKAFDSDASFGHGSGTINEVMRTGTNGLHGSAYWFTQPSAVAANDFFANRNHIPVQATKFNQEGFTIGGPVRIPKIYNGKDKLFWFFAFEKLTDSQPNTKFLTVPSDAERGGDFSSLLALGTSYQIYNPYSGVSTKVGSSTTVARQPFYCDAAGNPITPNLTPGAGYGTQAAGTACNKIPTQLIDPVALAYLKLYPEPNVTGTNTGYSNFGNSIPTTDDYLNQLGRLDWAMNSRNRLAFNVRHNKETQSKNNYFGNNSTGSLLNRENWGGTLDEVYTFTPTTVLDVRANYTRMYEAHPSPNAGFNPTSLGFPSYIGSTSQYLELPAVNFGSSCGSDTTQASSFDCFGGTGAGLLPSQSYSLFGSVVKLWHSHTVKVGADGRQYKLDVQNYGASAGQYTFVSKTGTSWTNGPNLSSAASNFGQDFAAFLLGLPTSGQYQLSARGTYLSYYVAPFIQDDWRVTHSLTLNLGVRYDHDTPYAEKLSRTVNGFNTTAVNPIAPAAEAAYAKNPIPQIPASSFTVPGGLTFAPPGNGDQWKNTSNIVSPRVGFAWSPSVLRDHTVIRGGFGLFVSPITMASLAATGSFSSTPISEQQGFSQTTQFPVPSTMLLPTATLSSPFPSGILQPVGAANGLATFNGQSIEFFNPDMKNPYAERWTFGVQQELTPTLALEISYIGNRSVHLPVNYVSLDSVPRQYLSTLGSRDQNVINTLDSQVANPFAGLVPGTNLNGSKTTVSQLLAPYPEYPVADSTTFGSGVSVRNANAGSSYFNSLNVSLAKRMSHGLQFVQTFIWSKLEERTEFLNASDSAPEKRISPFDHSLRSVSAVRWDLPVGHGRLLNVNSRLLDSFIGGWSANGIYTYQSGAPLIWMNGSTTSPGDYAFVSGAPSLDPISLAYNPRNVSGGAAFNVTQFATASNAQFKYHLRTMPTTFSGLRQDGTNNFDASVIKQVNVTERMYAQLRLEAFNVLNHPTFGAPNLQVTSSSFGVITSEANRPRQLQVGARFVF